MIDFKADWWKVRMASMVRYCRHWLSPDSPVIRLLSHHLSFCWGKKKNHLNLTVSHYLFLVYKPNTGDTLGQLPSPQTFRGFLNRYCNSKIQKTKTRHRTPAVCWNDSSLAIPQTQDLTDTPVIKRDFSRKTI